MSSREEGSGVEREADVSSREEGRGVERGGDVSSREERGDSNSHAQPLTRCIKPPITIIVNCECIP